MRPVSSSPNVTNLSIYDAQASALHADCDTLRFEDMHDGMVLADRLRIANPFQAG